MLAALTIRDVVLIDRLSLAFDPGLCVLTGETGAGKSILLDALGLALGSRGDSALVRHGATQAQVSAEFDLAAADHPAAVLLAEQGIEAEDRLVLRRLVTADGRSRAYINDQAVGVGLLRRVGEALVEVHGQFDTHGLLDPRSHRAVLDAYAGQESAVAAVETRWQAWRNAEAAREKAATEADRARAEEDYLRHAMAELDALKPQPGEEAELAGKRGMMQQGARLGEALAGALAELGDGGRGAGRALASALRQLGRVAERADGRLDPVIAALDRALAETEEASAGLQTLSADLSLDPGDLERLEERLFALRAAARKHGVAVDALAALRTDMARRLGLIETQGDLLTALARGAEAARAGYVTAAQALSVARQAAAARLDAAVARELAPLKLDRARFVTAVEPAPESAWGPEGSDRIAFLVATNPGAPPGPLNKIASGGELARFMLAIKVVLAGIGTIQTLVFDEVDTGIGGAVADAVGERLARLGRERQVLVVTHSPQVAARGVQHLQVRKTMAADSVATEVVRLESEERREEIARMLSGARITAEARAAADSLIAGGG